mmetsp:Transcript_16393/g.39307  ORF Transcript_16393/g.39307 Transcript_16393/m.39307 type:complete len:209 (+) Transcript_16393:269-895(+)
MSICSFWRVGGTHTHALVESEMDGWKQHVFPTSERRGRVQRDEQQLCFSFLCAVPTSEQRGESVLSVGRCVFPPHCRGTRRTRRFTHRKYCLTYLSERHQHGPTDRPTDRPTFRQTDMDTKRDPDGSFDVHGWMCRRSVGLHGMVEDEIRAHPTKGLARVLSLALSHNRTKRGRDACMVSALYLMDEARVYLFVCTSTLAARLTAYCK